MTEPKTPTQIGRTNASWAFVCSLVGAPFALSAFLLSSDSSLLFGIMLGGAAIFLGVDALKRLRETKPPNFLAIIGIVLGSIEVVISVAGGVIPSQI